MSGRARPSTRDYIKHPELGKLFPPGSWELSHSAAEIDLLEKAVSSNGNLTDAEQEQLLQMSGPLFGKTLGNPSALTEEERRRAMGWPGKEECKANLSAVKLGDVTPEDVIKRAAAREDEPWMTLEQAHLLIHRFNAVPLENDKWDLPRDQLAAGYLVSTEEERSAYMWARTRFHILRRGTDQWRSSEARKKEKQKKLVEKMEALREEQRKDYEERKAKGQLTDLEKLDIELEEQKKSLIDAEGFHVNTPDWVKGLVRREQKFGFCIYRAAEVRPLLQEYLDQESQSQTWQSDPTTLVKCLRSFNKLWRRFISSAVLGEEGEFQRMHRAMTSDYVPHSVRPFIMTFTRELEVPLSDAPAYRADHRMRREGGGGPDDWKPGFHPRYFLVMPRDGFPPMDAIIFNNVPAFPEVWVYDADWEPPADGDGVRDHDGYEGRLRVRYAYNVHVHFYPLTLEEGFDLKKLWMEQDDHDKPYPFPGTDINSDNIEEYM